MKNKLIFNVGDIISRSWRLYRLSYKDVLGFSFIFNFALCFYLFFLQIDKSFIAGVLDIIISVIIYSLVFSVLLVCTTSIIKAFYNALTGNSNSYTENLFYSLSYFSQRVEFYIGLLLQQVVIVLFGFVFMGTVSILLFVLLEIVSILFPMFDLIRFPVYLISFYLLCIVYLLFLFLSLLQITINAIEEKSIIKALVVGIDLIMKNLFKTILYAITLFVLFLVLLSYVHVPLILINDYIFTIKSSNLITLLLLLIGAVFNSLILPFLFSGVTYFYYEIKVKTEGLDLLNNIKLENDDYKIIDLS